MAGTTTCPTAFWCERLSTTPFHSFRRVHPSKRHRTGTSSPPRALGNDVPPIDLQTGVPTDAYNLDEAVKDFRTDLAAFLASEYPVMTMKDVIPRILSKRVRMLEEDAWEHPPSREVLEKARSTMEDLGTQYSDAFRHQNIVAIAHPTMPFLAPLLPTEGDALPSTFEVGGRQYPDTAILRNALPGPAFRAPALSIPAGLTRDGVGPRHRSLSTSPSRTTLAASDPGVDHPHSPLSRPKSPGRRCRT